MIQIYSHYKPDLASTDHPPVLTQVLQIDRIPFHRHTCRFIEMNLGSPISLNSPYEIETPTFFIASFYGFFPSYGSP
jgi:hypothetical protein